MTVRKDTDYDLQNRFSPDVVWDLSDEAVEVLGSEDETTIKERIDLTKKLNTLENGLKNLDAFTIRFGTSVADGFH